MKRPAAAVLAAIVLLATQTAAAQAPVVAHKLNVVLKPEAGTLEVRDRIMVPEPWAGRGLQLHIHAGLEPRVVEGGGRLLREGKQAGPVPLERFRLELPPDRRTVTIRYSGRIVHDPEAGRDSRGHTPGHISQHGVYLEPNSYWYPVFRDAHQVRFELSVQRPEHWRAVSQGAGTEVRDHSDNWSSELPQEGIFLVANRFERYAQAGRWGEAQVYLREPDPQLAQRYLDATIRYLDLYSRLIAPYPYEKFALVENVWETGYGMASFTLLGPRVLRLPFIIHTSYPHEVLHNWWGNSVYVDYATGNWAEGLTTYLSDHLLAQQRGQGAQHRRSALQKYADFVAESRDFPLSRFRSRHGEVTQAVGYSKGMFLFHMLRRHLGDEMFINSLGHFYEQNRFHRAGYEQLRQAFERAADRNLDGFFRQWVQRSGAPRLAVVDTEVEAVDDGFAIRGTLLQEQAGDAYRLQVPLALRFRRNTPQEATVDMTGKRARFTLHAAQRPVRLEVDPRYDVFRRLAPGELPPSLGQLFGAQRVLYVLPAAAEPAMLAAYRAMAKRWGGGPTVLDSRLDSLPQDRPVWVLGWDNRYRMRVEQTLKGRSLHFDDRTLELSQQTLVRDRHSAVIVSIHGDNSATALAWVGAPDPKRVSDLTRKLPHYSKYSYLGFSGAASRNVVKGQWPVLDSPLVVDLTDGNRPAGPLPALPAERALTAVVNTD